MLELEDAVSRILNAIPKPTVEQVDLGRAYRRVLAEKIRANLDLPVFDNSSVDGFAVRASDLSSATRQNPVSLRLIGRVAAGESFEGQLVSGTTVRIFTGSPIPSGADAVVMQEDAEPVSGDPAKVLIQEKIKPWENVRFRGEDVKQGAPLMEPGDVLSPSRISLLAATGRADVNVGLRPRVALIVTGSELLEPGERISPGKIYESNRAALASLVQSAGGVPVVFPLVPDELNQTKLALEKALAECDLVVTCGGVSVGDLDFVKTAFEQLGGSLDFWKVAIKPGRPFVMGRLNEKFLFGLPGNPISAFVTFLLLVRPAILLWQGARDVCLPASPGVLAESIANPGNRRHFVRVFMDQTGRVRSAGVQASHILSSAASANGLVDVPAEAVIQTGAAVSVLRWD